MSFVIETKKTGKNKTKVKILAIAAIITAVVQFSPFVYLLWYIGSNVAESSIQHVIALLIVTWFFAVEVKKLIINVIEKYETI